MTLADLRAFWLNKLREAQDRLAEIDRFEADLPAVLGGACPTGPGLLSEAARSLSRRGASAGGRARAQALTPERRSEIARGAAQARWGKKGGAS